MNLNRLKFMVVGAACVLGLSSCNYNSLVDKQQSVDQSWAEVENQYQRRADLIPNLVATVPPNLSPFQNSDTQVAFARSSTFYDMQMYATLGLGSPQTLRPQ